MVLKRKSIEFTNFSPFIYHVTSPLAPQPAKPDRSGKGARRALQSRRGQRDVKLAPAGRSPSLRGVRHRAPHIRGKGRKGAQGGGEAIEEPFVAL